MAVKPDRITVDGSLPFEHVNLTGFNDEGVAKARSREDFDEAVAAFHLLEGIHQQGARSRDAAQGW